MNLQELIDAVYVETNRPYLVSETLQAVLASTQKMHCIDYFYKDIVTGQVVFEAASYLQTLDTVAFPRFRNVAYLRKYDPTLAAYQQNPTLLPPLTSPYWATPNATMALLDLIAPDDLFDEFDCEKLDVYYQVGGSLMLKSSTPLQYLQAGWYALPDLQSASYNSWIAKDYPYAIIYDAASSIFQKTGMNEVSRKYDNSDPQNPGLVQTEKIKLLTTAVVGKGY